MPYLYKSGRKNSKSGDKPIADIFHKYSINNAYPKKFDSLLEKEVAMHN